MFLTLELTEIVLCHRELHGQPRTVVKLGGYIGIITALVAWYTSAAGVATSLNGRIRLPVGKPLI